MGTKSTENVGKSRENIGKSSKNIAKSRENFGKSKDRLGKSQENFNKSKENFGKSRENFEKSKLNVDKSVTVEKVPSEETLPNPNFYWGKEIFNLENGDVYEGEYCCHKSGIIWREGMGTYVTQDGHKYVGQWENDQLLNSPESEIVFPSQDLYLGSIVKGKYCGTGTFIFENKLVLKSEFENNKPVGQVTLIDYEQHLWKGQVDGDKSMILCVNHFFETIPHDRGVGKILLEEPNEELIPSTKSKRSTENEEELIFAKSKKTENDFLFDKFTLKSSQDSLHTNRSARSGEIEMKSSIVSVTLLKTFLSKEYRTRNFPLRVFTATRKENKEEEMLAE